MKKTKLIKLFDRGERLGISFEDMKELLRRKVYLIRHCSTSFNGDDERIRSIVDVQLNEDGLLCANNTGIELRNSGIECIYTSDMTRAVQTTTALMLNTGSKIELYPQLRAWNLGSLAGQTTRGAQDVLDNLIRLPNSLPPGSNESYNMLKSRTISGFYSGLTFDGNIAVITHYSNCRIILEHLEADKVDLEP